MNRDNTSIILGPPGTGKTTKLLTILKDLIDQGYHPRDIAYLAFTRKAAAEAKERVIEKFEEIDPKDIRWFRTIHSLAYNVARRSTSTVMRFTDYKVLGQKLGLTFSPGNRIMEDGTMLSTATKGDRICFLDNLSRIKMISHQEILREFPNDYIMLGELELYSKSLKAYKEARNVIDYTDFLYMFLEEEFNYHFKIVIVDEAQDLSKLQWAVVRKITANAEKVFVAGDDDQAIYNWAGADVDEFLNLEGDKEILSQSYRIPSKVHEISLRIASKIHKRNEKPYHPKQGIGQVLQHATIETLDITEGDWLLLGRNVYLLEAFNNLCLSTGVFFESRYHSELYNSRMLEAIRVWEWLRMGNKIRMERAKAIYDYLKVKVGYEYGYKKLALAADDDLVVDMKTLVNEYGVSTGAIWHEALEKLPKEIIQYVISCLKKGEKILTKCRISINTIHGVKGGEATNVAIMTDMARKTWDQFNEDPDSEHRVWYVGATRSKLNLHIIEPDGRYYYDGFWQ